MKIMGVLSCIGAVFTVIMGILSIAAFPLLGIIIIALSIPGLFVGLQWFKWLREDSEDNRVNVAKWMKIAVLITLVSGIV